ASARPDLSAQIQGVKQDLDALSASKPTTPQPEPLAPGQQPRVNTTALLTQAEAAGNDGRYADAERLIRQVLRVDKNNARAQAMLDRVLKARAFENGK
ncbi:MAG: hypothetical protein ACRD5L_13920, partial [Bryobacteraceae bacterium]